MLLAYHYFAQVRDKAVAYFVCGQAVQKNPMFGDIDMTETFGVHFPLMDRPMESLIQQVIAKLLLEPGQYTISCSDDPLAQIKTVKAV